MFLLIDNYDSFTYNLVQAFEQIGLSPVVLTNDDPAILDYAVDPKLKMVCISPGPSTPDQAGLSLKFLDKLPKTVPVLGVCLGHQLLGQFAGGEIVVGPVPMHGKTSPAFHDGKGLFKGLPSPMTVGRYHSLLVREDTKPDVLDITARTAEGEVMALRYKDRPWVGVQFHPESILTEHGPELLKNFVDIATGKAEPEKAAAEPAKTQTATPISVIIETLATGRDLSQKEAREAFTRLMEGELSPSQAAAFLLGLRIKGETPVEVGEAVQAILAKAIQVPDIQGDYLDIVGTGGDGKRS
ncbi:MAG: gamma-glutamyl-gamma-aminobutyrate hydrolase family protein, partial [Methylobacteriaceae bacterium]|nr:gamma-glutamyl-gamma-aminobutyrate hydrolase family protein [Methylobacteriaceae bacterium]